MFPLKDTFEVEDNSNSGDYDDNLLIHSAQRVSGSATDFVIKIPDSWFVHSIKLMYAAIPGGVFTTAADVVLIDVIEFDINTYIPSLTEFVRGTFVVPVLTTGGAYSTVKEYDFTQTIAFAGGKKIANLHVRLLDKAGTPLAFTGAQEWMLIVRANRSL